jgi:hypothetical protein
MKAAKETVEVNLPELKALLERKREALGEEDYQKLKKGLWAPSYPTDLIGDKDTTISQLRALLMKPTTRRLAESSRELSVGVGRIRLWNPTRFFEEPAGRQCGINAHLGG